MSTTIHSRHDRFSVDGVELKEYRGKFSRNVTGYKKLFIPASQGEYFPIEIGNIYNVTTDERPGFAKLVAIFHNETQERCYCHFMLYVLPDYVTMKSNNIFEQVRCSLEEVEPEYDQNELVLYKEMIKIRGHNLLLWLNFTRPGGEVGVHSFPRLALEKYNHPSKLQEHVKLSKEFTTSSAKIEVDDARFCHQSTMKQLRLPLKILHVEEYRRFMKIRSMLLSGYPVPLKYVNENYSVFENWESERRIVFSRYTFRDDGIKTFQLFQDEQPKGLQFPFNYINTAKEICQKGIDYACTLLPSTVTTSNDQNSEDENDKNLSVKEEESGTIGSTLKEATEANASEPSKRRKPHPIKQLKIVKRKTLDCDHLPSTSRKLTSVELKMLEEGKEDVMYAGRLGANLGLEAEASKQSIQGSEQCMKIDKSGGKAPCQMIHLTPKLDMDELSPDDRYINSYLQATYGSYEKGLKAQRKAYECLSYLSYTEHECVPEGKIKDATIPVNHRSENSTPSKADPEKTTPDKEDMINNAQSPMEVDEIPANLTNPGNNNDVKSNDIDQCSASDVAKTITRSEAECILQKESTVSSPMITPPNDKSEDKEETKLPEAQPKRKRKKAKIESIPCRQMVTRSGAKKASSEEENHASCAQSNQQTKSTTMAPKMATRSSKKSIVESSGSPAKLLQLSTKPSECNLSHENLKDSLSFQKENQCLQEALHSRSDKDDMDRRVERENLVEIPSSQPKEQCRRGRVERRMLRKINKRLKSQSMTRKTKYLIKQSLKKIKRRATVVAKNITSFRPAANFNPVTRVSTVATVPIFTFACSPMSERKTFASKLIHPPALEGKGESSLRSVRNDTLSSNLTRSGQNGEKNNSSHSVEGTESQYQKSAYSTTEFESRLFLTAGADQLKKIFDPNEHDAQATGIPADLAYNTDSTGWLIQLAPQANKKSDEGNSDITARSVDNGTSPEEISQRQDQSVEVNNKPKVNFNFPCALVGDSALLCITSTRETMNQMPSSSVRPVQDQQLTTGVFKSLNSQWPNVQEVHEGMSKSSDFMDQSIAKNLTSPLNKSSRKRRMMDNVSSIPLLEFKLEDSKALCFQQTDGAVFPLDSNIVYFGPTVRKRRRLTGCQ